LSKHITYIHEEAIPLRIHHLKESIPVLAEDVSRVVFTRQMEDHNILGSNCLSYMME
jgi:hypothetical protein